MFRMSYDIVLRLQCIISQRNLIAWCIGNVIVLFEGHKIPLFVINIDITI